METKRVTLDLTHIFQDYRKKVFVLIRPEWKNIECFQSHIINLFGVSFTRTSYDLICLFIVFFFETKFNCS